MARTQARGGKGGGAGVAVAGHDGLNGRDGRDSRPVPDPTIQTADLVDRATAALRELLEARLSAIDNDVDQLQEDIRARPAAIDVQIGHLQALHAEKFAGIETRISERDDLRKQAATDAKVGIDAALASAEKLVKASNDSFALSVDKSERATNKLLEQQADNQKNTASALEGKILAIKERVDRIEGIASGALAAGVENRSARADHHGATGSQVGMIGLGISLIAIVILVFEKVLAR